MAKKHPRAYPLEFRSKIIELVRAGRRPEDLATEFEVANQTVRNWVRQADLDTGKRTDGLTSEERTELFTLRKKVKQLTIEREILSKAAAWFARETETLPKKSSDSCRAIRPNTAFPRCAARLGSPPAGTMRGCSVRHPRANNATSR